MPTLEVVNYSCFNDLQFQISDYESDAEFLSVVVHVGHTLKSKLSTRLARRIASFRIPIFRVCLHDTK